MVQSDTLLIFDYSGTLSLEMPRFAQAENLERALRESGLAVLGVASPAIFWKEIVDPTWLKGSTTSAGYKRVIAERIAALGRTPGASAGEITAAASRFVERYLDQSRIEPGWHPLLAHLCENPDAGIIIATDHYAEATERIIAALGALDIPAVKAGDTPAHSLGGGIGAPSSASAAGKQERPPSSTARYPFWIANSADLGAWKADVAFWEYLKAKLHQCRADRLLVVDDFGFNEAAGDAYGEAEKIPARMNRTRETMHKVFQAEVEIIPFFLENGHGGHSDAAAHLIAETALAVERFLKRR